jgi:3-oxoacyl-[acyl-carrier protein] reductase
MGTVVNAKDRRVAIVTGGSRGIGAAVSERLALDGMLVNIIYRDADDAAGTVADRIRSAGGEAVIHKLDVADEKAVNGVVDDIADTQGGVHVLVNNAAVTDDRLVLLTKTSQWEQVLRVNLTGPFLLSRAVIPLMIDQAWGRIINISSNSARTPGPGQGAYAAAKGGLEALTRSLAVEVGRKGIRINTVAPGKVRTDMTAGVIAQLGGEDNEDSRWGRPEDVAGIVAFLARDEADYIQGQLITVDGGRSLARPQARGAKVDHAN